MKNLRLGTLVTIVIALWVALAVSEFWAFCGWETRAQFGEMFGPVNALFSGLAFAVIYRSLVTQQKEMEKQNDLAALAAFASVTISLWESNLRRYERDPSDYWNRAVGTRHDELMKVRDSFEKLLKEKRLI
jgi:hypothetical protein